LKVGDLTGGTLQLKNIPWRATALLVPVLTTLLFVITLAITLPQAWFLAIIGLITAYLLPPAGKETVIPVGIALGIPWWYMAVAIVMVDVIAGLFIALNFDLAYRIPFIGTLLEDLTEKTRQFLAGHPGFASFWFFTILLMVMVPVLGSGGIRGSVAGKILGLSTPLTFLAILAGSLIGCFGIALGSETIFSWLCANGTLPAQLGAGVCRT
jgi:hypothetical protein